MAQWLYKARDLARGGVRRATSDETRDFAVKDNILCRSARNTEGRWIATSGRLGRGHNPLFHRQSRAPAATHFLGGFEVCGPGDARFDEACELASVTDRKLAGRLRDAYAAQDPITGWLLKPSKATAPARNSIEVETFLRQTSTLVHYVGA